MTIGSLMVLCVSLSPLQLSKQFPPLILKAGSNLMQINEVGLIVELGKHKRS